MTDLNRGESQEGLQSPGSDCSTNAAFFVKSQAHLLKATHDNPQPTAVPPPIAATAGTLGVRHVLLIIGLPERGKPFIAERLRAYLSFFHGADVKLFNLCDYISNGPADSDENASDLMADISRFMQNRSRMAGQNMSVKRQGICGGAASQAAEKGRNSDPDQELLVAETDKRRKNVDSGKVAIVFSSESTPTFTCKWAGTSKERRRWVGDELRRDRTLGAKLIFIEVIVNNPKLMVANIEAKRRAKGQAATPQDMRDHQKKVKLYQRVYVTLQDDGSENDLSYIKLIDYGKTVVTNRMHGYLRMRIAQFLTTVHPGPHTIYLSRHGQSEYNVLGKLGGNPPLSAAGQEYARRLGAWVPKNVCVDEAGELATARLWTSSLQRTILTAVHIPHPLVSREDSSSRTVYKSCAQSPVAAFNSPPHQLCSPDSLEFSHFSLGSSLLPAPAAPAHPSPAPTKSLSNQGSADVWEQMSPRVYRNLDEIFAGEYEGMRYEDIQKSAPDEATLRKMDKIGYRYPRGESYLDILQRLDPLIHEFESYHEPLLIVSHQAVLRILYSYLLGLPRSGAPKVEIPLHSVMKITYDGWNPPTEERTYLGPEPIPVVGEASPV